MLHYSLISLLFKIRRFWVENTFVVLSMILNKIWNISSWMQFLCLFYRHIVFFGENCKQRLFFLGNCLYISILDEKFDSPAVNWIGRARIEFSRAEWLGGWMRKDGQLEADLIIVIRKLVGANRAASILHLCNISIPPCVLCTKKLDREINWILP